MKSIYPKGALLAAAALLTFSFSGCGGDKNVSKGSKETLTVGITNFADSLEPTDNYFGWQVMRYAIGECLVHFDNKMNPEPWIAESWKVSDDKLSWTFKIKDIKFSNGNKVTAEAVKKSLERTFAKAPRAKVMFEYESMTANGQELVIRAAHRPACPNAPYGRCGAYERGLVMVSVYSLWKADHHTGQPRRGQDLLCHASCGGLH